MTIRQGCRGDTSQSEILFELDVTATTDLAATPSWFRNDTDAPATPTGTTTVTNVTDVALPDASPTAQILRLDGVGVQGGFLHEVLVPVALPNEGYIIEVDIADLDDTQYWGLIGLQYEDYDEGGTLLTPRGLFLALREGAANNTLYSTELASTDYTRQVSVADFSNSGSSYTDTGAQNGGWRHVIEVRRNQAQTPAQWMIRDTAYGADGSVVSSVLSGVVNAVTELAGATLTKVGVGVYVNAGASAVSIDIRRLTIRRLPD